jgi:ribosomal protein S18 acetylase RimI-like enzyme
MIKITTDADAASATDAIVLGFCADPILRWMFPEPQDYLSTFPTVMRLFGGRAFEYRSAYHIEGFAGAALWLPPGIHPDEDGLVALFQEKFGGAMLEEIFSLFEQMDGFHPAGEFWHLAFIAVDPAQRGRGLGADLLSHTLKSCDTDNKLAYLESTNPANLSLYRRHGFELIGNIQAGSSPPLFPMIREPQ